MWMMEHRAVGAPRHVQLAYAGRAGVILALGAMVALGLARPFFHVYPFTLLYPYVIFAAWYGDAWMGGTAIAVSTIISTIVLPRNVTLALEEAVFVGASTFLVAVMCTVRRAGLRELTARKQAQVDRQQALLSQQQVEDALRMRDDFLTAASHDLRVPLTNVIVRTDLMRMHLESVGAIDAAWLRTQVTSLRYAAKRMLAMVEEITDAAQLQMGQRLRLQASRVDVAEMVHAVTQAVEASLPHPTPISVDAPVRLMVTGDQMRLERVVENLIANAVKFSPAQTPIHVAVAGSEQWAMVRVQDHGVGIPADELPYVFTRFYRATTAAGIPGAGIGLAGCKSIVEQHGGYITVESTVGKGTTVTMYLPGAPPEPEQPERLEHQPTTAEASRAC